MHCSYTFNQLIVLIDETETIQRVGFIQSGHCTAFMEVPQTRINAQASLNILYIAIISHSSVILQLVVGELGPGYCVGEGLMRGTAEQPYKVTTVTRVRIGWVSSTAIRSQSRAYNSSSLH